MIPLFESTVAAIATPSGRGAVALLRVSGPEALSCVRRVCPGFEEGAVEPRVQRLLAVHHPTTGERIDRALVCYFPAPASYTGDDTVELSTHGGVLTPQLVLDALYAAGARPAEPGEFTRRAVLNGKLDLLQAEAVLDLIDGRSPALHRAAVFQLERGLSRRIQELRASLLEVEALLAYSIDFPEEDEPPVPPQRIVAAALALASDIERLLATAPQGELLREGALVVLAGRPNSGKSSLFNALIGAERAIVTDLPGTTRDALEASILVEGYPFRLVDTAGLRQTDEVVEGLGIQVARRFLRASDIVLMCAEAGRLLVEDELCFLDDVPAERVVMVRTKLDLCAAGERCAEDGEVALSAHTGVGMPALRARLLAMAFGGIVSEPGEAPLITRERHVRALREAHDEIESFVVAMNESTPGELASTHLRAAGEQLEDLIGAITPDDVLGRVFSAFCIGK